MKKGDSSSDVKKAASASLGRDAITGQFTKRQASMERVKESINRNIDVFIRLKHK